MSSAAAVSRPPGLGRVCAIHQPHYLPWLRYFAKAAAADVFLLLDDVAFTKNGWQNRNKVKTAAGPVLLTVPVHHRTGQLICDVEIDNGRPWAAKHRRTLEMNYGKAPCFGHYWPALRALYERPWEGLAELAEAQYRLLAADLGLEAEVRRSSEFGLQSQDTDRLVDLCRAVGADTYLSGEYAVDSYLRPEAFPAAGLQLALLGWEAPTYAQRYPKAGFAPDLSVVDLLFNEGSRSRSILAGATQIRLAEPP